jgi:dTMP kinase
MILDNFAVLEGIDGAGTTTQLSLIEERIKKDYPALTERVVFTAEPTQNPVGTYIRKVLSGSVKVAPGTLAYLFAADRFEHLYGSNGIVQSVGGGKCVVCDRYLFSSLAYQSPQCGQALVQKLNGEFPLPRILFYFEIDVKTALTRIAHRDTKEIFETQAILKQTAREYERVISDYETRQSNMRSIEGGVPKTARKKLAADADIAQHGEGAGLRAGGGLSPFREELAPVHPAEYSDKMTIVHIDAALSVEKIHQTIWSFLSQMPIFTV